jgi:hypothetical protein
MAYISAWNTVVYCNHTPQPRCPCWSWSHLCTRLALPSYKAETRLSIHLCQGIWLYKVRHRHVSVSPSVPICRISESLYNWRFTANQFFLAPSPSRLTTRHFFIWTLAVIALMYHFLWREDWSVVYNCCWPSPAQSLSRPSTAGLMITFYCLRFETPPTWRDRSHPQEQGGPVIPPGNGFPFRRLLRLAGLRWRYLNPPPRWLLHRKESACHEMFHRASGLKYDLVNSDLEVGLQGCCCTVCEFSGGTGKTRNTWVRIASILAHIRTEHLQNTNLARCRYTTLLGIYVLLPRIKRWQVFECKVLSKISEPK